MNRGVIISGLFVLLFMLPSYLLSAQEAEKAKDDINIWSTVSLKKSFGQDGRWGVGLMQEYRHKFHDGVSEKDQWFMRSSVYYSVLPWVKLQYQMDLASTSSGFNMRFLPEITVSHKEGNFTFALRQRAQTTWKVENGTNSTVLRTRAKIDYKIQDTPLSVNFAVEPYWCDFAKDRFDWFQKCRWYAGFDINITETLTFSPQYNCQAYFNHDGRFSRRTYDDHIIYFTLTVKL